MREPGPPSFPTPAPAPAGGQAGRLAALDWASTPLGPRQTWSPSLNVAVGLVLAAATPMALRWGPDLVLIYNDAYAPILGDRHPAAFGQTLAQAWPEAPDLAARHQAILGGAPDGVFSENLPATRRRRGDVWEEAHFTVNHSPVPDDTAPNGVGGVLVTAVDITDAKRTEAALRAAETDVRIAVEATGLGRWDHNPSTGARFWNPRCLEIFGIPPGADQIYATFDALVHPDDRGWVKDAVIAALDPDGPGLVNIEYRIHRMDDGQQRWIEAFGRALFTGRVCTRFVGVVSDVTERKAAAARLALQEATLRLAVESADVGTWDLDLRTGILTGSERYRAMLGFGPDETVSLDDVLACLHPDDRAATREAFDQAVDPAIRADYDVEHRVLGRADGVERWIAAKGRAVFDEAGQPVRAIGTTVNITERKRAEMHLRLLVNELNHRVKNSLATIQAIAAQTFRGSRSLPEAQEAFTSRIIALAEAHDVLTRENWEGADMLEIARRAATLHGGQDRFALSGPAVRLAPRTALSLSMALHELATNALKYGALSVPAGHVAIAWSVDKVEGEARLVLVWTEGGGPPVAPPTRKGFGSRLIEKGLAAELAGQAEISYAPTGVVCRIVAPLGG